MDHLTDEQFKEAKDDIVEGLGLLANTYRPYIQVLTGISVLKIPPEEIPENVRSWVSSDVPQLQEFMREWDLGIHQISHSTSPGELWFRLKELIAILASISQEVKFSGPT